MVNVYTCSLDVNLSLVMNSPVKISNGMVDKL